MDRHLNRLNLEIKRLEEEGQIVPLVPPNPPPETNGTSTPSGTPSTVQQITATATAMATTSSRTGTSAPIPQRTASTTGALPVQTPTLGTPTPSSVRTSQKRKAATAFRRDSSVDEVAADEDSQVYCFCQQVSFGEMVACDNESCQREWFHLPCVGLSSPPQGTWYCDDCLPKMAQKKQSDKKRIR
jgi:hypothetical protein